MAAQVPLEVTLNGGDAWGAITASTVLYAFYKPSAFNVSSVFPLGGPTSGGTQLAVYLIQPHMLVDLGGGEHGVFCRFTYTEVTGEFAHVRGCPDAAWVVHDSIPRMTCVCVCGTGARTYSPRPGQRDTLQLQRQARVRRWLRHDRLHRPGV